MENIDRIRGVARRVVKTRECGHDVIAVVSAMGDQTNKLIQMAHEISDSPNRREMDMLITAGERISISLLTMAIHELGYPAISFTGSQSGIITNTDHTDATIIDVRAFRIEQEIKKGNIVVVAGFQGVSSEKEITTLGRGGTDTTAVALAHGLGAERCELYKDVDCIYTADPKIVDKPIPINEITYDEMLEFASMGSKVLHDKCISFAREHGVKIYVKSVEGEENYLPEKYGTMVSQSGVPDERKISGIAHTDRDALITMTFETLNQEMLPKLFASLSELKIKFDGLYQTQVKSHQALSFLIKKEELSRSVEVIHQIAGEYHCQSILFDTEIARISIIARNFTSEPGLVGEIFASLAKENIRVDFINSQDTRISFIVHEKEMERAIRTLHRDFVE